MFFVCFFLFYFLFFFFFFFNDTATTEIYTLSLHDALPIWDPNDRPWDGQTALLAAAAQRRADMIPDRKSTRLNSSHVEISYAVFCLKKKKIFAAEGLTKRNEIRFLLRTL